MAKKKVIIALDNKNLSEITSLVKKTKSHAFGFKIGKEFFYNYGIEGYKKIYNLSNNIFLDLKLHDIPNTVERALKALIKLKPILTTIHISGGDEMQKVTSNLKRNKTFSRQKHKKPRLHKKVDSPFKVKTFNQSKTQAQYKPGIPLHISHH